ncbi:hypothetical protein HDU96_002732 [Phlyctochytrium bullatum]|nr:hypothetical protein HDU96_002732 [Phlyctochytrium bullatum]
MVAVVLIASLIAAAGIASAQTTVTIDDIAALQPACGRACITQAFTTAEAFCSSNAAAQEAVYQCSVKVCPASTFVESDATLQAAFDVINLCKNTFGVAPEGSEIILSRTLSATATRTSSAVAPATPTAGGTLTLDDITALQPACGTSCITDAFTTARAFCASTAADQEAIYQCSVKVCPASAFAQDDASLQNAVKLINACKAAFGVSPEGSEAILAIVSSRSTAATTTARATSTAVVVASTTKATTKVSTTTAAAATTDTATTTAAPAPVTTKPASGAAGVAVSVFGAIIAVAGAVLLA